MPRCRECKQKFEQKEFNIPFCKGSIDCLTAEGMWKLAKIKKIQQKESKEKIKKMKESLKTKQDYEKELEAIFNRFIRERDKDNPCISCGKAAGTYKLTAGHFFPAGSYKNLRFHEDNVHGQCWWNCNKNKSGNLLEYRVSLVELIGQARVDELDRLRLQPRKYTIPELIIMKEEYKERIKKLKR